MAVIDLVVDLVVRAISTSAGRSSWIIERVME